MNREFLRRLNEDEPLRSALLAAPTRVAKQDVLRDAGLEPPDHHDVLQTVTGGFDAGSDTADALLVPGSAAVAVAAAVV